MPLLIALGAVCIVGGVIGLVIALIWLAMHNQEVETARAAKSFARQQQVEARYDRYTAYLDNRQRPSDEANRAVEQLAKTIYEKIAEAEARKPKQPKTKDLLVRGFDD